MGKKFIGGLLAGGLAASAVWKSLDPEKKQQLADWANEKKLDVQDWASEYALEALDAVDNMVSDHPEWADRLKGFSNLKKQESSHFADHFMSDNFDEQTADLRESLAREKANDDSADDIIIDKTEN